MNKKTGALVALLLFAIFGAGCSSMNGGNAPAPQPARQAVVPPPAPLAGQGTTATGGYTPPLVAPAVVAQFPQPRAISSGGVQAYVVNPSLAVTTSLATVPASAGQYDSKTQFGYKDGFLVSGPRGRNELKVRMLRQEISFSFKCSSIFPNTQHSFWIYVDMTITPSVAWESKQNFASLVARYAGFSTKKPGGNVVSSKDIAEGTRVYMATYQDAFCSAAIKRRLADVLSNLNLEPSIFRPLLASNSPFNISVTGARMVFSEDMYRAMAAERVLFLEAQRLSGK